MSLAKAHSGCLYQSKRRRESMRDALTLTRNGEGPSVHCFERGSGRVSVEQSKRCLPFFI